MHKVRIGIIGGGLAGLTTAYLLLKENYLPNIKFQIDLLEATDRIGGRIYTLRQFSPGIYAEAGALVIGDNERETLALIKELKLKLLERPDMVTVKYILKRKQVPWPISDPGMLFKKYILDFLANEEKLQFDNQIFDYISMTDFLKKKSKENNDDANLVIQAVELSLLGLYCDDLSKISALDGFRYINHYRPTKNFFSIKDGNDRLPFALENILTKNNVTIIKNSPVTKIKRSNSCKKLLPTIVTTIDSKTREEKVFTFDYVIIATPLSALQDIVFSPALPINRRTIMKEIHYNRSLARIYYEFDRNFWKNEEISTKIMNHPTVWIENHSTHLKRKNFAILELHASGKMGKKLQNDNQVFNTAKEELAEIWGKNHIDSHLRQTPPIAFFWTKKPFQQGAYPYFGVGQSYYPLILRKKLHSIFFAGEYTSLSCHGTIVGAIKSAHRVVNELKNTLLEVSD